MTDISSIHLPSLIKRMLVGGVIALALITIFLAGVGDADPAWPKFWIVRPLIIVPLAGATGGGISYFLTPGRFHESWKKVLAVVFSILIYLIGLWLGTVLGLDGTLWN